MCIWSDIVFIRGVRGGGRKKKAEGEGHKIGKLVSCCIKSYRLLASIKLSV